MLISIAVRWWRWRTHPLKTALMPHLKLDSGIQVAHVLRERSL
ncbi:MAG TPA: hypothetical protein VEF72_32710 [Mycobacterium sp.]|nr:hypothetical protein [Mycobacterium sp.]